MTDQVPMALAAAFWIAMSKLVTSPLHEMAMTMQRAEAGDLSVRVPLRQPADEVTWLARNFNSMIERLAEARLVLGEQAVLKDVEPGLESTVGVIGHVHAQEAQR